jgi:hypothetical protein
MPLRFAHAGEFHLDEDRYFADTAHYESTKSSTFRMLNLTIG